RVQQRLDRPERQREGDLPPDPASAARGNREALSYLRKHGRRSALETVDRLLLVTDGEQRAGRVAGAGTREEFGGERADHLPLHWAGVRRLAHPDVVQPP